MCVCVCTGEKFHLIHKKKSFSPYFLNTPSLYGCARVSESFLCTKGKSILLGNVLATPMHNRIWLKYGRLLFGLLEFSLLPTTSHFSPSHLYLLRKGYLKHKEGPFRAVIWTVYMIQFQGSTLAGSVHFVRRICIFLWDENAIN